MDQPIILLDNDKIWLVSYRKKNDEKLCEVPLVPLNDDVEESSYVRFVSRNLYSDVSNSISL